MPTPTYRHRRPTVVALMVVLGALGLGALAVGVAVALGARTSPQPQAVPTARPVAAAPVAPSPAAPRQADPAGPDDGARSTTTVAREVLRDWDRRRESAWVAADVDALSALYLPGSVAGDRDRELLQRWTHRGVRVTRLQPQVLELRVVRDVGRSLVIRVTDRLTVEATVGQAPVALPQDGATSRRIVLRRGPLVTSRWRVASVVGVGALGTPASLEE